FRTISPRSSPSPTFGWSASSGASVGPRGVFTTIIASATRWRSPDMSRSPSGCSITYARSANCRGLSFGNRCVPGQLREAVMNKRPGLVAVQSMLEYLANELQQLGLSLATELVAAATMEVSDALEQEATVASPMANIVTLR